MQAKALALVLFLFLFGVTSTVQAQDLNSLDVVRCQDYLDEDDAGRAVVIYYLDGALTPIDEPAQTSVAWLTQLQGTVQKLCEKNKKANLATIVDMMSDAEMQMPEGDVIDLVKFPCSALMNDAKGDAQMQLYSWFIGYAGLPMSDDPQHVEGILGFLKKLETFCTANPTKTAVEFVKNMQ